MVRQTKILKAGGKIDRETRRFDEERGVTISVRKKEFEADYGYIDEPDLGIYHIREMAESIKIRESPQKMTVRLAQQYGIDQKMAKQLVNTSVELAELFEDVAAKHGTQSAVKWVAGPVSSNWKSLETSNADVRGVVSIIDRFVAGEITDTECGIEIRCLMTGEDLESVKGASGDLDKLVNDYLDQNPGIIDDYRKNDKAANKAIGFVMKNSGGSYSSAEVVEAVKRNIESRM